MLLTWLYVAHEISFDTFRPGADRTYRVLRQLTTPYKMDYQIDTHGALTPKMIESIAEIESANRIRPGHRWVQYRQFAQRRSFWYADPNYLVFWGINLERGDLHKALKQPGGVVISQEAVAEFFPNGEDPMGKVLEGQWGDYIVTGILSEQPRNTHFNPHFVTATLPASVRDAWSNRELRTSFRWVQTFIRLYKDADPDRTEQKLRALVIPEENPENTTSHRLQSLLRTRLYGREDFPEGIGGPGTGIGAGDLNAVRALAAIGILVLFVACINFVNLSTARAALRAREVGMRKVVGAGQRQLAFQFLLESVLLTILALPFCLILTGITRPYWQQIVGQTETLSIFLEPDMAIVLLAATVLVGLFSGMYPAFLLSRFSPIAALHSQTASGSSGSFPRRVLVILQFTVSIFLVFVALVAFVQLNYVLQKDLGFKKENILALRIFDVDGSLRNTYNEVKQRFLKHPDVLAATASASLPGEGWTSRRKMVLDPSGAAFEIRQYAIDEDLFPMIGIDLVAGRNFSADIRSDFESAYILNETAVEKLGLENPVGKPFKLLDNEGWIIGVVEDFHMRRLTERLRANAFVLRPRSFRVVNLRLATGNVGETMQGLEEIWKTFIPVRPIMYAFLDDRLEVNYGKYLRFQRIFAVGFGVSFLIASIGLLGLAAYTSERRRKEIGIRKVFGASIGEIAVLLGAEFTKLVLIANLIAWPFAYLLMQEWLQDFAYRANMGLFPFVFTALGSVLATLLVVGFQCYRASSANPIEALRRE